MGCLLAPDTQQVWSVGLSRLTRASYVEGRKCEPRMHITIFKQDAHRQGLRTRQYVGIQPLLPLYVLSAYTWRVTALS
jgi:hypothetical protein